MGKKHWPKQLLLSDSQEIEEEKKRETNALAVAQDSERHIGNIIDAKRFSNLAKFYKGLHMFCAFFET